MKVFIKNKVLITLGLLFFTSLSAYYYIHNQSKYQQFLIASLQDNDFFIFSTSQLSGEPKTRFDYAIAKIININDSEVSYQIGSTSYRYKKDLIKAIRLDTLMIDNYFLNEIRTLSISELQTLSENGSIIELMRPTGRYLFGGLVLEEQKMKLIQPTYNLQEFNESAVESYQLGDIDTAFALFKKGAESGETWAQINLANMYIDGEGTDKNIGSAIYWLNTAYESGNPDAQPKLKLLCQEYNHLNNEICSRIL
ncbi:tetratricopeptide repeat protein [Pseudoalteromonas sp. T1lg24]|uniref:tetratricopeptide repeat protein n=1 Tax=Pseudoalteromonas sp. T1lg24 TaxID=2077099 RepID=UPI000CF650D3|nr:SEL1-like repeat protein [Pseudoalteromonas sp. T1lg24]